MESVMEPRAETITTVYKFPNGFRNEAESMCGWLRYYQFVPTWVPNEGEPGGTALAIPESQVSQLRLLQKTNPARWGNP